jgi:hypothetical protein
MKNTKWIALIASVVLPLLSAHAQSPVAPAPAGSAQGQPAAVPNLSPGTSEVVQMASAGSGDDVLLAYIQNSQSMFQLSADQVIYLKDVGLSSQVITAMLNRDNALRGQSPAVAQPVAPVPVSQPAPPSAPAPAAAPAYVSTPPADVTYFYNDLAPYGAWIDLPGYGWCWQPTVVAMHHDWRPYCDSGHWVYTDAGWCWTSDYSWGWAPFHYGRWYMHERCGWVWLPDRVWGPAWVTWRTGGDYCGWAPLPPHADFVVGLGWRFNGIRVGLDFDFGLRADCFAFIGIGDFNGYDLGHRRLGPAEVTRIYNRTTIINSSTVNNNIVVNRGIGVERVAAATHTQIHKAVIRDMPAGAARNSRVQGSDKSGSVVYRPQLNAPSARPGNMVAQRVDAQHPVIQHTAVSPARTDLRSVGRGNVAAPSAAPRQTQPAAQTAPSRVAPSSSPARSSQPPTRAYQPAASAEQSQTRPAASFAPAPRSTPVTPQAAQPAKEPARAATSFGANAASQRYPLRTSQQSEVRSGQSGSGAQSPQYLPKSYHQAAEAHSLPPINPRPAAAPSTSGKNPDSGSRK